MSPFAQCDQRRGRGSVTRPRPGLVKRKKSGLGAQAAHERGSPDDDPCDEGAEDDAEDAGQEGFNQPGHEAAGRCDRVLGGFEDVVEDGHADLGEVGDDQVAADPQHRDRADDTDDAEDVRHDAHDRAADVVDGPGAVVLGVQRAASQTRPEIVGLHEQCDEAVHEERHEERDPDEDGDAHDASLAPQAGHGHEHDFGAEDQVGAGRGGDDALLEFLGGGCPALLVLLVVAGQPAEFLEDLLAALEAQVRAAHDQQEREKLRGQPGEQERDRQDDEQLVDEGAARDLADDGQLARRAQARHVLGRHRGVVDDDAHRLRGGLDGVGRDVVDRRGRDLREGRDIVEQCDKSTGHEVSSSEPDVRLLVGYPRIVRVGIGLSHDDFRTRSRPRP